MNLADLEVKYSDDILMWFAFTSQMKTTTKKCECEQREHKASIQQVLTVSRLHVRVKL